MIFPNSRIDFIDSNHSEEVLLQLLAIYDDRAVFTNYGDTTNIAVLYISDILVGGALVRMTANLVIVKRMCTSDQQHSVIILQYLTEMFAGKEMHINVHLRSIAHYLALGFVKKNRSAKCMCIQRKFFSHLSLSGPLQPVVATVIGIQ